MSKSYFEKSGYISASFLKELSQHPKQAKAMIDGDGGRNTPSLDFGSLVDTLLTQPYKFEEQYIIYRGKKPTDKLLLVAEEYIKIYKEEFPKGTFDVTRGIISAQNTVGYDNRLKPETMIERFDKECKSYCDFAVQYEDKIIIDQFTYDYANRLSLTTKSSPYLQHIFEPNSNYIVLFQVPIYVTTTKFVGKCLLDCVVIDLVNKSIIPYDFKTFEGSFEHNYWVYKYYYQEAWYRWLLLILTNKELFIDCEIPEELKIIHNSEYTIDKFNFIAIDKSEYKEVEIFQSYPNIVEDVVLNGFIDKGDTKVKIKSITELIEESKYRLSIDNWRDDIQMLTNGFKKLWL